MVFQDPMTSLNPAFTIGTQLVDTIRLHRTMSKRAARAPRASSCSSWSASPTPSAGSRTTRTSSRAGCASARCSRSRSSCEPRLLIADEPTTALDVTVQAQILDLLRSLQARLGMAVIFVTHDLGVVADLCSRVVVMYAGQIVEEAPVDELFARPQHPYTEGLLAAIPQSGVAGERLASIPGVVPAATDDADRLPLPPALPVRRSPSARPRRSSCAPVGDGHRARCIRVDELVAAGRAMTTVETDRDAALLEGTGVVKHFPIRRGVLRRTVGHVRAVDGVDLAVDAGHDGRAGRRVGLGEVDARAGAAAPARPDRGHDHLRRHRHHRAARTQDPRRCAAGCSSCSRTRTRRSTRWRRSPTAWPSRCATTSTSTQAGARRSASCELLRTVGLDPDHRNRYPREFSGGQLQRIAIARALALVAEAAGARRAGEQPRRVDPGRRHQPARRPPGRARARVPVHRPRPRARAPRERPHRGDVPRSHRRAGSGRRGVRAARSTRTPRRCCRRSRCPNPARQRERERIVLAGRHPVAGRAAAGMPLPHPLPLRDRACRTIDPPAFTTPDGTTVVLPSAHRRSRASRA